MTKYEAAAELSKQTVKELSGILAIGNVAGRSKATTKAQKIEMILVECFHYEPEFKSEPDVVSTPKTAKAPKVTRRSLAVEAGVYEWEVVAVDGIYFVNDRMGRELARAKTIKTIAKRLDQLMNDRFMSDYHATERARKATYGSGNSTYTYGTNCYCYAGRKF